MTPAYARELADQWTHQDPVSKQGVLDDIRGLKPHEFALVSKAVYFFYGPKAGGNYLMAFLDAVIGDGPPMANDDDESTLVVEDVTPITPAGTTPVPNLSTFTEPDEPPEQK